MSAIATLACGTVLAACTAVDTPSAEGPAMDAVESAPVPRHHVCVHLSCAAGGAMDSIPRVIGIAISGGWIVFSAMNYDRAVNVPQSAPWLRGLVVLGLVVG